jgi:hypothetical protein
MVVLKLPEASLKTIHGLAERHRRGLGTEQLLLNSVEIAEDAQNEAAAPHDRIRVNAGLCPTIQVSHMLWYAWSSSGAIWKRRPRISSKLERGKGKRNGQLRFDVRKTGGVEPDSEESLSVSSPMVSASSSVSESSE